MMTTFAEIQKAILSLPKAEYQQLRRWLDEMEWEEWDREIELDSRDGKLDFLVTEAIEAKENGSLRDL